MGISTLSTQNPTVRFIYTHNCVGFPVIGYPNCRPQNIQNSYVSIKRVWPSYQEFCTLHSWITSLYLICVNTHDGGFRMSLEGFINSCTQLCIHTHNSISHGSFLLTHLTLHPLSKSTQSCLPPLPPIPSHRHKPTPTCMSFSPTPHLTLTLIIVTFLTHSLPPSLNQRTIHITTSVPELKS